MGFSIYQEEYWIDGTVSYWVCMQSCTPPPGRIFIHRLNGVNSPGTRYMTMIYRVCGPAFLVFFAEHTHDTRTHVFLFLHHPPAHCITTVMTNTVCTSLFLFSLTSCYLLLLEPSLFARLPLDSHSLVLWDGR